MTREEAIELLDNLVGMVEDNQESDYDDALKMVIEALRPDGDTISRQTALDTIEERIKANGYGNVALVSELNRLYGYIRRLPSAQSEHSQNTPQKQPDLETFGVKTGETCADAISRQEVIEIFTQLWDCVGEIADRDEWEDVCKTTANELPSAQPDISDRKVGKWIVVERHEHYPSGKPYEQLQCPFCKRFDNNGDGSFCGYCGTEMKGEEDE